MAKQEQTRVPSVGGPTARIESVVITWCSRRTNRRFKASVDLSKVSGIIWRHPDGLPRPIEQREPLEPVPHTSVDYLEPCDELPGRSGEAPEHSDSSSQQQTRKAMTASSSPSDSDQFCWWDGNQWICPDEPVDQ